MYKNIFWKIFFLLLVALVFWFISKAASSIVHFFQLSKQIEAHIENWQIKEIGSDKYVLSAHFSYEFEGKTYTGEGFLKKNFRNPWVAEKARKNLKENWQIWLNPKHPSQAALQKTFPLKAAFSATAVLAVAIYFFSLGLYYRGKHGSN